MTWLRHSSRHVHRTLFNRVGAGLGALHWMDADQTPFGAPVVSMVDAPAIEGDQIRRDAAAGQVWVTLGDEPEPDPQEMGGPLACQEVPVFFDVFMDTYAHAIALANDVRDILLGRVGGGRRHMPVIDQVTGAPAPGWSIELTDVIRTTPDQMLALHWQVVKATANVYFPEEPY